MRTVTTVGLLLATQSSLRRFNRDNRTLRTLRVLYGVVLSHRIGIFPGLLGNFLPGNRDAVGFGTVLLD